MWRKKLVLERLISTVMWRHTLYLFAIRCTLPYIASMSLNVSPYTSFTATLSRRHVHQWYRHTVYWHEITLLSGIRCWLLWCSKYVVKMVHASNDCITCNVSSYEFVVTNLPQTACRHTPDLCQWVSLYALHYWYFMKIDGQSEVVQNNFLIID